MSPLHLDLLIRGQVERYTLVKPLTLHHYFTSDSKVYSDKILKLVIRCNDTSEGALFKRLSSIYSHIIIYETWQV